MTTGEPPVTGEQVEGLDEPSSLGEYPIDSLLIRSENRTVFEVVRRIKQGMYVLDPEFQRDFIWDPVKQSRLIESVLMRIPLPVIYLAENPDGKLVIVDGLQRLTTFDRFLDNKLKLVLENSELFGKTFEKLSAKLQNRIEDTQLVLYLIDSKVPERARLDIFERVNGGVPLTRQQMRNALHQGKATTLLRELAGEPVFQEATGQSLDRRTMRDREAINRFCAFHLLGPGAYPDDMDQFLADALVRINGLPDDEVASLRSLFLRSMRNNIVVFARHAFRKHEPGQTNRKTFNMSLFDVCSTGLAGYPEDLIARLGEELHQRFYGLLRDTVFVDAITYGTSDRKKVLARFQAFDALRAEVLGAV